MPNRASTLTGTKGMAPSCTRASSSVAAVIGGGAKLSHGEQELIRVVLNQESIRERDRRLIEADVGQRDCNGFVVRHSRAQSL